MTITAGRAWCPAAVVLVADQLSKSAAPWLAGIPGLPVDPLSNAELSLGSGSFGRWGTVAAMLAGVALAGFVLSRSAVRRSVPGWAAGLILGGALSNLLDRVVLGAVRDFLVLGNVVLNLADLAVVVGLPVVALGLWRLVGEPQRVLPQA